MTDTDPAKRGAGAPAAARHPAPSAETAGEAAAGTGPARPARWDVATLCGETGEAILIHKGEQYRLRVTARGRLILTK